MDANVDVVRGAGLVVVMAACVSCARPAARAPAGTAVDACRAAVAAAIADDVRTRTSPDPHPTYLLDFRYAPRCATEVEHVAAELAAEGHDTFPWDPSFDRPLCVRTGRWCADRPVRRAVHLTLDERRFPHKDLGHRTLPVPRVWGACETTAPGRAAFSVLIDAAGEFGTGGYDVSMTCDEGKWTVSSRRLYIVY
jgi:hypothetical protein